MSDKKSNPVDDKRVVGDGFSIFAFKKESQIARGLPNRN